jgi:hypothetical protein
MDMLTKSTSSHVRNKILRATVVRALLELQEEIAADPSMLEKPLKKNSSKGWEKNASFKASISDIIQASGSKGRVPVIASKSIGTSQKKPRDTRKPAAMPSSAERPPALPPATSPPTESLMRPGPPAQPAIIHVVTPEAADQPPPKRKGMMW